MKLYIKDFALSKTAETAPAPPEADPIAAIAPPEAELPEDPAADSFNVDIGPGPSLDKANVNPTQKLKEVLTGLLAEESDVDEQEEENLDDQTVSITED
jgi:hypothetical protein